MIDVSHKHQVFCALSEWRYGTFSARRFDGEVYQHLYRRFIQHMESLVEPGKPSRKPFANLQKSIATDGL